MSGSLGKGVDSAMHDTSLLPHHEETFPFGIEADRVITVYQDFSSINSRNLVTLDPSVLLHEDSPSSSDLMFSDPSNVEWDNDKDGMMWE